MIESIKLENFKSHRSTHITLDASRLHALVGQNSSGKTSVLEALSYMSQLEKIENKRFYSIFKKEKHPQLLTTIGEQYFLIYITENCNQSNFKDLSFLYGFKKNNNEWCPLIYSSTEKEKVDMIFENSKKHIQLLSDRQYIIPETLKYSVYLKLIVSDFNQASYSDEVTPKVKEDGSGLAPTLDFIRNEAPKKFQELKEMLRRIVPGVKDISIRRAKVKINRQRSIEVNGQFIPYEEHQSVTGQEIIFDMNTGDRIPAHAISEGTMLALGLLTVLMHPNQPNLVLLDDIEQGLHPKAQRELMDVLKEILKLNENLQIILSTHSPYIVDELNPSQVHVLNNTHGGFTVAKRLDEHPDIEWAKQTLTTGEFWDAEGEEWVVGSEVSE